MPQYDVVAVGDATIDAFLTIKDPGNQVSLLENNQLCFPHGEKISVDKCSFCLGGIACNVAVGLSRQGAKTALCAEIGDDEFSQKIINDLQKEKVDLAMVQQTKGQGASFAIGIDFKGERTLFVEHVKRNHNFNFEGVSAHWVYLAGLGQEWQQAYQSTLDFAQKNNAKLAFSPGTTQLKQGYESFAHVLPKTEILFVNREEAMRVLRIDNHTDGVDIRYILTSLKKLGPKIAAVTDGIKGSYAIDQDGKMYFSDSFPSEVVERTGAGDAYTSGFLSAIIGGFPVVQAMQWGTINAASVVGQIGAQGGLLTKKEIQARLNQNPDFQAKKI